MTEEEGTLKRWHRRKTAARIEEATEEPEAALPVESAENVPADIPDLPDIDSLDAESDFSVFMREGVPEPLRRLALRKLWGLDPVLANLDGLVDYGEDFTDAATVVEGMKTAYRVGKGMLEDHEIEDGEDISESVAAEPRIAAEGDAEASSDSDSEEEDEPPAESDSASAATDSQESAS